MLANKWFLFALSAAGSILTIAAALNWSSVVSPSEAATVVMVLNTALAILHALMPPASQPTIVADPKLGGVFTHT